MTLAYFPMYFKYRFSKNASLFSLQEDYKTTILKFQLCQNGLCDSASLYPLYRTFHKWQRCADRRSKLSVFAKQNSDISFCKERQLCNFLL